jgi:hypothetical protein
MLFVMGDKNAVKKANEYEERMRAQELEAWSKLPRKPRARRKVRNPAALNSDNYVLSA